MNIKQINLVNFRNYENQSIELKEGITIFYGENAQGKTNILEAIFLGSIGKSFRTNKEKELLQFEKNFATVEIEFKKNDREGKIKILLHDKKDIFMNGIKISKLSELLGNIQIVLFCPEDITILRDGPQKRRRFLDMMIGQLRPNYVYILNRYNKTLEQRNNYLKQVKLENKKEEMLDIWDENLSDYAQKIYLYRKQFMDKLSEKINIVHEKMTDKREFLSIKYESDCEDKKQYLAKLREKRQMDILKGFTSKGVHRDDFSVMINQKLVNIYGSQGQNRSVVLSLKMAELQVIYEEIGEYPILLLDDFMSELDQRRRKNFLENIKDMQVIITCTDKMEIPNQKYQLYHVEKGAVR